MASLTNVLASIPGLAGYYAKDELNRSQTAGDIQQIGALSNLQAQMQARQRQEAAKGISGMGVMTNDTSNIAVGVCHIDVATSRCYLPSQVASGNTFKLCGWYEI
jgi:hypothetical protein